MLIKKDHINVDEIEDYLSMAATKPSELEIDKQEFDDAFTKDENEEEDDYEESAEEGEEAEPDADVQLDDVPKNEVEAVEDEEELKSVGSGLQSLFNDKINKENLKIDKFRVLVSLGSEIDNIHNIDEDGMTITYGQGDICDRQTGEKYSTQIRFMCELSSEKQHDHETIDTPVFFAIQDKCRYVFTWKT